MGADTSVAQQVEAPPLKPLALKTKLAPTPARPPKYLLTIKNAKGEDVVVGDPRATRALVALMDVHAVNGGAACHWGGPAAFAEMMAAIHAIMFATKGRQWHEAYNFVNDAGHAENGIYALRANYGFDDMTFEDLKGFRGIKSKLTGHGESHLNPEGVLLSNGPLGSALPQAQGLAIADKVAKRDRVTICVVSDGASMEGEAKEAFAAIPGLAAKDRVNPFVMLISDNDTKLSGRITKDSFSMQRTFQAMGSLGWNVISVPERPRSCRPFIFASKKGSNRRATNPNVPVCLWVKTIKGYGVKSTMENAAGGHGFPLANGEKIIDFVNEIYGGQTPEEFANWAQVVARRLGKEGGRKESEGRRRAVPLPRPSRKTKSNRAWPKAAIKAARGRSARLFHFIGRARLDRHQRLPENFSRPLHRSGHCGSEHGQHRRGFFQGGLHSHRRYVRAIRRHERKSSAHDGGALASAGHRDVLARRFSGRRRRRVARSHDLLRGDERDSAHDCHRAQLRG